MRRTFFAAYMGMLAACSVPVVQPPPGAAVAPPSPAALADEGRYGEAIALLEQRVQGTPSAAALGDLGYAYYLAGRFDLARSVLERACLADPSNPVAWERLAALLEAMGDSGRALEAMRHARTLREAKAGAAHGDVGLWPAGMARIEVRQAGAGLVEVARVEREGRDKAGVPGGGAGAAAIRLEVSNGNGIRGMAAAVARRLRAEGMQVVRLTNTIPFNVEHTRVEIRSSGEPQIRIVLGKDLEIKKAARG